MRPVGAVVEPSIFHFFFFFLVLARETLCYINAGFASLKPGVAAFLFGPGCSILFFKNVYPEERLEQVTDPKVACLLLQAQVVTAIPDSFFSRTAVTCIDLSHASAVTAIGRSVLSNCTALTNVDLSGLQAVTSIGENFLCQCTSLSKIDLSGLQAVTSIGKCFLYECTSLSTVDLSGLQGVDSIGGWFLGQCTALETFHGKESCSDIVLMCLDPYGGRMRGKGQKKGGKAGMKGNNKGQTIDRKVKGRW